MTNGSLQEIVLVHRVDGMQHTAPKKRSRLEAIESVVKMASLVAVPLVVGWGGWIIDDTLSKRATSQDYVALAVSLLAEGDDKKEVSQALRNWAVDVLEQNSPTPLGADALAELKSGEATLPLGHAAALEAVKKQLDILEKLAPLVQ